ncbi:hypothetical protein ACFYE2_08025 [Kocuria sp. CPCC 205300]|uniref:hypothetical protein n=1 Tax=Kocuria sabuli TaxID=3071448 RepID=UPI0036DCA0F0
MTEVTQEMKPMSLQASTYLEGNSHELYEWLIGALATIRDEFPTVRSYGVEIVDDDEVSVTLELGTTSFGEADDVAQHVIERLEGIEATQAHKLFETGETELVLA